MSQTAPRPASSRQRPRAISVARAESQYVVFLLVPPHICGVELVPNAESQCGETEPVSAATVIIW
jgi:hypothetical protein